MMSVAQNILSNGKIICKQAQLIGKDVEGGGSLSNFKYYPTIFLERIRKTVKNVNNDGRPPGRGFNPGPCE
jgi:hypothetical protein